MGSTVEDLTNPVYGSLIRVKLKIYYIYNKAAGILVKNNAMKH